MLAMTGVPNGTRILCKYLELMMLCFYCSPSVQGYFKTHQIRFTPIMFIAALRLINDSECNQTFIWLCSFLKRRRAQSTCFSCRASCKAFYPTQPRSTIAALREDPHLAVKLLQYSRRIKPVYLQNNG